MYINIKCQVPAKYNILNPILLWICSSDLNIASAQVINKLLSSWIFRETQNDSYLVIGHNNYITKD